MLGRALFSELIRTSTICERPLMALEPKEPTVSTLSKEEIRVILQSLQSRLEYAMRIGDGPMRDRILAVMEKVLRQP